MLVIYIKDLVVKAKHGTHPHEKETAQRFNINLELTVDTPAGRTDELADTIDYSELRRLVIEIVQANSFDLLEKLTQAIAEQILADKRVRRLSLSIDKPDVYASGAPGVRLEITV